MRCLLSVLFALCVAWIAQAASHYVDGAASGAANGTSWADAWHSPAQINWASVSAGDTIYISGGPAGASQTYTNTVTWTGVQQTLLFTDDSNATAGNPVTITVGQDALHNGTVILDARGVGIAAVVFTHNFHVLSGRVAGSAACHIRIQNATDAGDNQAGTAIYSGQGYYGQTVEFVEVTNCNNGFRAQADGSQGVWGVEWRNCQFRGISGDSVFILNGATGSNYVAGFIHDNYVEANTLVSGFGPDIIQGSYFTASNNVFVGMVGAAIVGTQHQDAFQANYFKALNNTIINMGNSGCESGVPDHCLFANNVFALTNATLGAGFSRGVEFSFKDDLTVTNTQDFSVLNNTFVNFTGWAALAVNFAGAQPVVTNWLVLNNLVYNCGNGSQEAIRFYSDAAANTNLNPALVDLDYNLLNAGTTGSTTITIGTNGFTQPHPRSGEPTFVAYSGFSPAMNLRLSAADTGATGLGTNLSAILTTDLDNKPRPAVGAWDIGAFNNQGPPKLMLRGPLTISGPLRLYAP